MFALELALTTTDTVTALTSLASTMPDIQPDFNAPGMSGLRRIASWALGLAMVIGFIALVFGIVAIATKGFGNRSVQEFAGKAVLIVGFALILLGSASGLFGFFVGFDLGL